MILPRQRICALLRPISQTLANFQPMSTVTSTTTVRLPTPTIWSFRPPKTLQMQPLPVTLPSTLLEPSWTKITFIDPTLPLSPLTVPKHGPMLRLTYPEPSPVQLPASNVIEKSAARMIVIRKRKMRKHKLRKLRKRMFFEWAKVRQRRQARKERAFQTELVTQIKAAEKFDPQAYVEDFLKRLHQPIVRIDTRPPIPSIKRNPALYDESGQRVKPRKF